MTPHVRMICRKPMPLAMPQSWAFASRGLADSGARPDSSGKGMTPPPFDCTAQPSVASMATRPCLSSDARNHFMVVGDASLPKPAGSHMTPPVSGPTPISVEPSAVRAGRGAGACSAAAPARHRARLRAISTCARRPRFLSRAPGGCCSPPPPRARAAARGSASRPVVDRASRQTELQITKRSSSRAQSRAELIFRAAHRATGCRRCEITTPRLVTALDCCLGGSLAVLARMDARRSTPYLCTL